MKAALINNDQPINHFADSSSIRKRYSRELVISLKEVSSKINFPVLQVPARVPRGARKKSQSNDQDGHKLQDGSREDLNTEELDGPHSWHRVNRGQWHAGNNSNYHHPQTQQTHGPTHPRQRYPSGPHGETESFAPVTSNAPLRPAPDTRRGGHGDWSRGCAGWRQRSYSGSERSTMVTGQHPRGRGGAPFVVDGEDSHGRGRGRGRGVAPGTGAASRFPFQHRGGGPSRGGVAVAHRQHSSTTSVGVVHSPRADNTEEFWQDDDWVGEPESPVTAKSRERLNSITHTDLPPVVEQIAPRTDSDQLVKGMANLRVYSKSCSLEPPPGFGIPSMARQFSENPTTTEVITPSTSAVLQPAPQPLAKSTVSETTITDLVAAPPPPPTMVSVPKPPVAAAPPPGSRWLYVDSTGQIQGPFSNTQMSGWMAAGFLPLSIELRRDCDECFLTLADHVNLAGRVPFWDGYALPPITRSNAHILVQSVATIKPRWLASAGAATTTPTAPTIPVTNPLVMVGASGGGIQNTTAPNGNTATAAAAAAAATAVLFATATLSSQQAVRMVTPSGLQQQTLPPRINGFSAPTAVTESSIPTGGAIALGSSSTIPPTPGPADLVSGSQEFIRLYTEAQALAAHAAKVEAERKELVEKLAVINSTAAKLLASTPGFPITPGTEQSATSTGVLSGSLPPGWEQTQPGTLLSERELQKSAWPVDTAAPLEQMSTHTTVSTEHPRPRTVSVATSSSSDDQHPAPTPTDAQPNEDQNVSSPDLDGECAVVCSSTGVEPAAHTVADTTEENYEATVTDGSGKKSGKKKNKKHKKNKMTAEQERQLAWEAEFERRKQAALKRKLDEEAEAQRLAEEEAAARAAEQAAIAQEQARLLMEQRKREAQRAKAGSQLEQLRLPQSARWGTTATGSGGSQISNDSGQSPSSLLSIQAAQALEEAEQKRREALMAEQVAVQLQAAEAMASPKRPQAWASVVNSEAKTAKPTAKTAGARTVTSTGTSLTVTTTNPVAAQAALAKTEFPHFKSQTQPERPKQSQELNSGRTNHGTKSTVSASSKAVSSTATIVSPTGTGVSAPSIWDLPNDGKVDVVGSKPSKKQKKKNANLSSEAASFAAKEELAHWCESQLSSMPLSGVDLPTLVDLLCELEAADQVVEFIETSLGRSKRTSKFSKAFLEKRAFILNTVP